MKRKTAKLSSRRQFLKTAGATALAAGAGPAVIIPGRAQPKTLKILHRKETVPSYGNWFDEYAKAWGKKNDIRIILDWIPVNSYGSVNPQRIVFQPMFF